MPGEMVGSVDGWLGFLGGYSGGLLAFFSAYLIFNKQRKENVRPFIITDADSRNPKSNQCLYFLNNFNVSVDSDTYKTTDPNRDDDIVDFSIKNIGLGPALDINIFNSKGVKAVLADFSQGVFQEYSSLGHLEVGASNSWFFLLG